MELLVPEYINIITCRKHISLQRGRNAGVKMKAVLSVAIPCYNSAAYMQKAVNSVLQGGTDVEILIIDDGSTDGTAKIADDYAAHYSQIRAIHQENGGHGAAVMRGLREANGVYFRVLDSDDWLDKDAFKIVLNKLKELSQPDKQVDLFVSDYIYDKLGTAHKRRIQYKNALPQERRFLFDEMGKLHPGQYILMHAATYRREFLLASGLDLPRHTFYVDNLYVYVPMKDVKWLYYSSEPLYHYFIGREDQSVHESVMMKRIDQQLTVNRKMMDAIHISDMPRGPKRRYLRSYLEIITCVSSIMLLLIGTPEADEKRNSLWEALKKSDKQIYTELQCRFLGRVSTVKSRVGRKVSIILYRLANRIFGFN